MTNDWAPVPSRASGRSARLALQLWDRLGADSGFPRDPEPRLAFALPVAIHEIAALSYARVVAWAERQRLPVPAGEQDADRPLSGCLLAYRGRAFLLVDPADPPAERRLTLAHELGHFLIEVDEPRVAARRAAGVEALSVLDGDRPALFAERLDALLAGVSLRPRAHLMTREPDGSIGCARIAAAECAADDFALELLAPRAALAADVRALATRSVQQRWALTTDLLQRRFGLPVIAAGRYARTLVDELTGGVSVREWLGLDRQG